MVALETVSIADGDIAVTYLQQVGPDPHLTTPDRAAQIDAVASQIADFIGEARSTIDVAIYDFRLRDEAARIVSGALRAAVKRGVAIRIAYDAVTNAGNEQARPTVPVNIEADKKSPGTETFVSSFTDIAEIRPITGYRVLMHNKYIIRDGLSADAAVFTGSAKIPAIHRASNSALSRMNQAIATLAPRKKTPSNSRRLLMQPIICISNLSKTYASGLHALGGTSACSPARRRPSRGS